MATQIGGDGLIGQRAGALCPQANSWTNTIGGRPSPVMIAPWQESVLGCDLSTARLVSRRGRSSPQRSRRPSEARRCTETNEAVEPVHYLGFHTFGTAVWGASINTGMFDDLKSLADQLVNNFVTVHFPRNEPLWQMLNDDLPLRTRLRCLGHALRGEMLRVGCHRMAIRNGLWNHGCQEFLDRAEGSPGGGWRVHIFFTDDVGTRLLPQVTTGTVGPGDPVNFDSRWFVEWRLRQIAHNIGSPAGANGKMTTYRDG